MNREALGIYLNDHLAGSVAGRDLAERIRSSNEGTDFGTFMGQLVHQIDEDRDVLDDLMKRLGIEQSSFKQAVGSLMEKLASVKFDPKVEGDPQLNRLLQIELLQIGVEGKQSMWRALKEVAKHDQLPPIDMERLIDRAQQQLDGLERLRLGAAVEAFASVVSR